MANKKISGLQINGLILSAGFSSRLESFKPLLNYRGKPFVLSILEKLYPVCANLGIVTGYKKEKVEEAINKYIRDSKFNENKINLIYNSEFEKGMFNSFQAGLKEMCDCDWLLYHFVDQPHLPVNFYSDFNNQIDISFNWIQPVNENKKGHPILIHNSIFPNILNSKSISLKDISYLTEVQKKFWNCDYPQVIEDIDTKEEYQKLI